MHTQEHVQDISVLDRYINARIRRVQGQVAIAPTDRTKRTTQTARDQAVVGR